MNLGYSFAHLGIQSAKKGFGGLEFASGIPGSIGGSVFMNAGANGREVKDTLISCMVVDSNGKFQTWNNQDLEFAYRYSRLQKESAFVVEAKFQLQKDTHAKKKQKELLDHRLKTQPYDEKTCGCVFRNPEEVSAGFLIEKSGLKGFGIGDMMVSTKHANFFVNKGKASAKDMLSLIEHVRKTVQKETGYLLELEVKMIQTKEVYLLLPSHLPPHS